MAHWLDTVFLGFDSAILGAIHSFAVATNGFFTPFMYAVTCLANDGLGMILLGLVLLLFRRTRKVGVCVLGAIIVGALITNVTLKPLVMRPRPYADETRVIHEWWVWIGSHKESIRSFPSGHTTSAMAAMTAIFLTTNKKYSWTAFLFALLMGFTRMYFVVHYPTDIIGGLLAGGIGALIAYFPIAYLWRVIEQHEDKKFFHFVLHFDIIAATRSLFAKKDKNA